MAGGAVFTRDVTLLLTVQGCKEFSKVKLESHSKEKEKHMEQYRLLNSMTI